MDLVHYVPRASHSNNVTASEVELEELRTGADDELDCKAEPLQSAGVRRLSPADALRLPWLQVSLVSKGVRNHQSGCSSAARGVRGRQHAGVRRRLSPALWALTSRST